MVLTEADILVLVDIQNDFLPGGALGIPGSDKIIPILNNCIKKFISTKSPIVLTRDWHPEDHCSFKQNGGMWPEHCIVDTIGARFAPTLQLPKKLLLVSKGTSKNVEAYSGFEKTDLANRLRIISPKRLFIGGLATDYCVKATILDALTLGYSTYFIEDGSYAVNINENDGNKAIKDMQANGAVCITSKELLG